MQVDPATGLLDAARCLPSPNCDERPVGIAIDLIVIHGISLPPGQFGGPVSAHLLIRRDGDLTQYAPFHRRAWHAGPSEYAGQSRCNDFSIGIELEGADQTPYADDQYQQLAAVIPALRQAYPAITPERLVGHADIAPGRKTDPGPAFDWARLRRLLSSR